MKLHFEAVVGFFLPVFLLVIAFEVSRVSMALSGAAFVLALATLIAAVGGLARSADRYRESLRRRRQ